MNKILRVSAHFLNHKINKSSVRLLPLTFNNISKQTVAPKRFSSTSNESNETINPENPSSQEGVESPTESSIPNEKSQIEQLNLEIKSLKDQVLRSLAEEENVRRIARKDVESARQYANTSFAKAMLEIADNLERALQVETNNVPPEKSLEVLIAGISMTEKSLQKAFSKFGVVKYGTVGDIFDPSLHEVLFQIPDVTKPANTIGQVLKTGYKLNDRVIRAAEVGTIVHPNN